MCVASYLHKNSLQDKEETVNTVVLGGGGSLFAVD